MQQSIINQFNLKLCCVLSLIHVQYMYESQHSNDNILSLKHHFLIIIVTCTCTCIYMYCSCLICRCTLTYTCIQILVCCFVTLYFCQTLLQWRCLTVIISKQNTDCHVHMFIGTIMLLLQIQCIQMIIHQYPMQVQISQLVVNKHDVKVYMDMKLMTIKIIIIIDCWSHVNVECES